jgi:hypothetical protein
MKHVVSVQNATESVTVRWWSAGEYGALLEDIQPVLQATSFSDEAHFHLNNYVNKKNIQFWASGHSRHTVANPLDPQRVTV